MKIEAPPSLTAAADFIGRNADSSKDDLHATMIDTGATIADAAGRIAVTINKIMANEMAPVIARKKQARDATFKILDRTLGKIDASRDMAERGLAKLQAETDPKAPADGPAALYASECRAALLRLPVLERGKMVEAAIRDGDDAFAAAALLGSTRLTGLGVAERDALLDRYRRLRHADTMSRIEKLTAGLHQLDRLSAMFMGWSTKLHAEDAHKIKLAEESEAAAREALENAAA